MKTNDLRKTLLKESAIFVCVLGALVGGGLYLDSLSDDYHQANTTQEGELTAANSQVTSLKAQFDKVQKNSELYDMLVKKNSNDELSINRQGVRSKFDEFKTQYYLNNVRLSMSAVQEVAGGSKYKDTANVIVSSEVTVTFDALNDEDVYRLLESIRDQFSGVTRVTKFKIVRASKLNDAALSAIVQTGQYAMVQGELKFNWYGLKPIDIAINPLSKTPDPKAKNNGPIKRVQPQP